MLKILITGAHGQVGSELEKISISKGWEVLLTDHENLDITDPDAVQDFFNRHCPDICINAAAYTAVDNAESDSELAFAVNRDGAINLAGACKKAQIPLLHISTDYVFDGNQPSAYLETDEPNPASVYGKSKWEGDQGVSSVLSEYIILRVAWVFATSGNNFVKTMLRLAKQREELGIVADQKGAPTWAGDIATVLTNIVEKIKLGESVQWGTYHFIGKPVATWFEFANEIFRQALEMKLLDVAPKLNAITTEQYPTPAKRPLNSVLSCKKIEYELGIEQPDWKVALKKVLLELKENGF